MIRGYVQVYPIGLRSAIRLYVSYLASLLSKLIAPSIRVHVENFIPGNSPLTVRTLGVIVNIRPRSEDLHVMTSNYEPITSKWVRIEPGNVVVDVGAHIGRYTLTAARERGNVIAIEADPSNFSLLTRNIRMNRFSNVIPLCLAIGNEQGESTLYIAERAYGSTSSLKRGWAKTFSGTRTVNCEKLDNVLDRLALRTVDWLKIDVEGHEVSVLQGASKTLARTRNLVLEITKGNEDTCTKLISEAGLNLVAVGEDYDRASNWLFSNKSTT